MPQTSSVRVWPVCALVWLLGLVPGVAAGQVPGWRAGALLGLNRTSVSGGASVDPRLGSVAGLFGALRTGAVTSLRAEATLSRKVVRERGCTIEGCQPGGPVSITTTLSYLEVPMLFEVNSPWRGVARPFAYGGPFLGLRVGCHQASQGVGIVADEVAVGLATAPANAFPCGDSFTHTSAGFIVGGGVAVRGGAISLRWSRGLTNIARSIPADGGGALVNGKSSSLSLVVELTRALGR